MLNKEQKGINMNKRYLPIGSVVKLKNNNKSIMITGYYSVEYANDLEIYDYSGCAYPEGVMIKSSYCSFNSKRYKRNIIEGYKTEEYTKLTNELNDIDNEIVNSDTKYIESKNIELDKLDNSNKKEDFVLPHYEFDENGVINQIIEQKLFYFA